MRISKVTSFLEIKGVEEMNMDGARIPSHTNGMTAWVSERTTKNSHFPYIEDPLNHGAGAFPHIWVQGASIRKKLKQLRDTRNRLL